MNVAQKETKETKRLLIGWSEVDVVAVNPTKEKLMKLLEIDDEEVKSKFKEPEYTGEKDGDATARVVFYVKNKKTNQVDNVTFSLKNVEQKSKTEKSLYLNQVGETQWTDSEDNLWDSFKNFQQVLTWEGNGEVSERYFKGARPKDIKVIAPKKYRKAVVGESDLVEFIKAWLLSVDYNNVDTDLLLDTKKLFSGNFRELESLFGLNVGTVVVNYAVKNVEKDGEYKEYQTVSNKFFLSGNNAKMLRNYGLTAEKLEVIKEKYNSDTQKKSLTPIELFFAKVTDEANGISKSDVFYTPFEQQVYDSSMNYVMTTNNVVDSTDSDY